MNDKITSWYQDGYQVWQDAPRADDMDLVCWTLGYEGQASSSVESKAAAFAEQIVLEHNRYPELLAENAALRQSLAAVVGAAEQFKADAESPDKGNLGDPWRCCPGYCDGYHDSDCAYIVLKQTIKQASALLGDGDKE